MVRAFAQLTPSHECPLHPPDSRPAATRGCSRCAQEANNSERNCEHDGGSCHTPLHRRRPRIPNPAPRMPHLARGSHMHGAARRPHHRIHVARTADSLRLVALALRAVPLRMARVPRLPLDLAWVSQSWASDLSRRRPRPADSGTHFGTWLAPCRLRPFRTLLPVTRVLGSPNGRNGAPRKSGLAASDGSAGRSFTDGSGRVRGGRAFGNRYDVARPVHR